MSKKHAAIDAPWRFITGEFKGENLSLQPICNRMQYTRHREVIITVLLPQSQAFFHTLVELAIRLSFRPEVACHTLQTTQLFQHITWIVLLCREKYPKFLRGCRL